MDDHSLKPPGREIVRTWGAACCPLLDRGAASIVNWPLCAGDYAAERRLEVRSSTEEGRCGLTERIPIFGARPSSWIRFWDDIPPSICKEPGTGCQHWRYAIFHMQKVAGMR